MSFNKLLAELDEMQLAKSNPADGAEDGNDDAAIAAAAADGEAAGDAADAGDDGAGDDAGGEGEDFGKSFKFTLENGEEVDAVDGTELVKSLMGKVDLMTGRLDDTEGSVLKALGGFMDLVKSQGETISNLQAQVTELASAGRGRRTVVTVAERPEPEQMNKSQQAPEGIPADEFLTKALAAQDAGKISGRDVAIAEGSLLKGIPVPQHIVTRVLA